MTARNGWLLAITWGALSGMGCSHTPVGYQVPGTGLERVTVLTEHDAMTTGLPAWSLAMPLGAEEDASVLKFLEQAEASGAKYLTDVDMVFAAESNGQPLECRTHFLPVMAVENQQPGAPRYYVRRRVMEEVTMSYGPGCAPEQRSAGEALAAAEDGPRVHPPGGGCAGDGRRAHRGPGLRL